MVAGIAATSPSAVANRASAIPGATTAKLDCCIAAIARKLFMIPQTVPNSPTKGALLPIVASIGSSCSLRALSSSILKLSTRAMRSSSVCLCALRRSVDTFHSPIAARKSLRNGQRSVGRSPCANLRNDGSRWNWDQN